MKSRCDVLAFDSDGVRLSAVLHLPVDASGPVPGVVVAGTWTSVKEQMAERYAQRLAGHGIAALAFDFTGFGESGGVPRDVESARLKTADLRNAVTFLARQPEVDPSRVGALGICAGAMYASAATVADERLRSLALVAPWLHDADICAQVYGGPEGVAAKIALGERARERYRASGVVEYVPAVSAFNLDAAMPMDIDFYLNPARGGLPRWPNRFAVMAWPEWLTLDAVAMAPDIRVPTLLVHSPDAAIPEGARRFHAGLKPPSSRMLWTTGDQFDFYDREPNVTFAARAAAEHFHATL